MNGLSKPFPPDFFLMYLYLTSYSTMLLHVLLVRMLPVTLGQAVVFTGYYNFLHHIRLPQHGRTIDEKWKFQIPNPMVKYIQLRKPTYVTTPNLIIYTKCNTNHIYNKRITPNVIPTTNVIKKLHQM